MDALTESKPHRNTNPMLRPSAKMRALIPVRYLLIPSVALIGIGLAVYIVRSQVPRVPIGSTAVDPPHSPFEERIAGIGTVLPSSDIVSVGTALAGVVEEVAVIEGESVAIGQLLFRLDSRQTRAELGAANARLRVASAKLAAVKALPRETTLRESEAVVASAAAQLVDAKGRLARLEELGINTAASRNEQPRLEYEVAAAQAGFDTASARRDQVKQGAWPEDLAVAAAEVAVAQAEAARAETQLERESVKSTIAGTVLYIDIDPGEHVVPGSVQQVVAIGALDPLHVRVQIDEMDAWRFRPESKAVASARGGSRGVFALRFLRGTPLIIPKRLLSGDSAERVDVRVMEVEYELDNPHTTKLMPGQLVDVFIEAPIETEPDIQR